jgi:hypothetical protein
VRLLPSVKARLRVVALLMVCGLAIGMPLGQSASSAPATLVASGSGEGPGWIYLEVRDRTPGPFSFEFWAHDIRPPAAWGSQDWWMDAHAQTEKSHVQLSTDSEEAVLVETAPLAHGPRRALVVSVWSSGLGYPGFRALSWIAGTTTGWSFELRGDLDMEILELRTGNTSFLYTGKDFPSKLHAEAYVARPGARVQLEAALDVNFTGRWAGSYLVTSLPRFVGVQEPATWLNWTAPSGETEACRCDWAQHYDTVTRGPPGLNRFEFTSITAGDSINDEIYFTGVDFGDYVSRSWS